MASTRINSSTVIPVDQKFKLSAGPGAGKTTWLINHLKNIVKNSQSLGEHKKIACITYTNVAVDTIISRLGDYTEHIEVCTIHSFLYKHIVKPYLFLIKDKYGINIEELEGHDEVIPSISYIQKNWKKESKQFYIRDNKQLINSLLKLQWFIGKDGNTYLGFKKAYYGVIGGKSIKTSSYDLHKKYYWGKGKISHDDVLMLAYELIRDTPDILRVLRAKFPYLMIDEFQDTSSIQTEIVKKIAKQGTVVGVIGDRAQSIYSFQNEGFKDFDTFNIEGIKEYTIHDNNRSTSNIINILNLVRRDLTQECKRKKEGNKPRILVGNRLKAYNKAKELCDGEDVYSLSYRNDVSNSIKYEKDLVGNDLLSQLISSDNNRGRNIMYIIKAIEYTRENRIKDALKNIKKIRNKDKVPFQDVDSLELIRKTLGNIEKFENSTITYFYNELISYGIFNDSKILRGEIKSFYDSITYKDIAIYLKLDDYQNYHKTIHKSKGDEFDNVLLILHPKQNEHYDDSKLLEFILEPDLENKEEHRINYVAISRARENLFINVEIISEFNEEKLKSKGLDIIKLD